MRHGGLPVLDVRPKPRPLQRLRLCFQDAKGQSPSLALEIHASGLLECSETSLSSVLKQASVSSLMVKGPKRD